MGFKRMLPAPNYQQVVDAFKLDTPSKDWYPFLTQTGDRSPVATGERTAWIIFLKKCGLQHISFTRLEVVNKKRYAFAKLKYGF